MDSGIADAREGLLSAAMALLDPGSGSAWARSLSALAKAARKYRRAVEASAPA